MLPARAREAPPGQPSTHPAEGRDQGQQGSRDAVLIQGGTVLRAECGAHWDPFPLTERPCPPGATPDQQLPPPCALGSPGAGRGQGVPGSCARGSPELPPPSDAQGPSLTCRQQFIMRTTKSNCWWSRTARFCCTCRCSSWARQRRAARPFRALSTAGSSWGQGRAGHRAEGEWSDKGWLAVARALVQAQRDPKPSTQRVWAQSRGLPRPAQTGRQTCGHVGECPTHAAAPTGSQAWSYRGVQDLDGVSLSG